MNLLVKHPFFNFCFGIVAGGLLALMIVSHILTVRLERANRECTERIKAVLAHPPEIIVTNPAGTKLIECTMSGGGTLGVLTLQPEIQPQVHHVDVPK